MSSSTDSNHTVTIKNPLKDIANWIDWYEEIKNYAQRIKVWDYVNPTFVEIPASEGKEAVTQPIHESPTPPRCPAANETIPNLKWLWKSFDYEKREYDLREAELRNLTNAITASVSGDMTRYIKDKYLAKDMLESLHRYAAPQSDQSAPHLEEEFNRSKKGKYLAMDMLESLHRYAAPQSIQLASHLEEELNRLKKGKKDRNQSNLDYAHDWLRLQEKIKSVRDLVDHLTDRYICRAFIAAANSIERGFRLLVFDRIAGNLLSPTLADLPTLVDWFLNFGSFINSQDSVQKFAKTTLGAAERQPQREQRNAKGPFKDCICGVKHWFGECPHVNSSRRSKDHCEDPAIIERFKRLPPRPLEKIYKQLQHDKVTAPAWLPPNPSA